jgi:predicted secreted protein
MIKRMSALTCVLILLVAALAGCSAAAARTQSIAIPCDQFVDKGSQVTVTRAVSAAVGDVLTVTLCSNPSTGFSWENPKFDDSTVMQLTDHATAQATSGAAGAAGTETFTFKSLKSGKSTITMDYSRPWTGGEKGVWKAILNVEVK